MKHHEGFTLIELVIVIIVLGILAAVAIPRLFSITNEAETATVANMVAGLESAMSIYSARQYLRAQPIAVHNPFDDLSNIPANYNGAVDPVDPANTPDGTWSWRAGDNWIIYNPRSPISGGMVINGETFIAYQVQTVLDGTEVVGLRLTTTDLYEYAWQ
ncbi:MAG: hypothetical protein CVT49_13930 [candidate division Zixibacteria bacterium HGW-Zixibacteria-1]|nr:MAG: hypothetical protein CVT49_13930 [candidate division Zixibacteria bacterium HGW-Zixibacteria-1]